MVSSIISSFAFAGKQFSIFAGIPLLIVGILGGFLNTIVFLSLKTFRQSSCAFYLTAMSIVNIGQLITGLLSRIMITGFFIDWTESSLIYCKFRVFFSQICSLLSCTCLCLATIDQFFATCSRPRWQQWSNIKVAYRLLVVFVIIWTLHGIPSWIFFNQVQSSLTGIVSCTTTNIIFQNYRVYFTVLILIGILPVIITMLFGFMAYRNVQQLTYRTRPLVRRELDKQLTVMVLVQVAFNACTSVPLTILNALIETMNVSDDPIIAAKIQFITTIINHLIYLIFIVSEK